MDAMQCLLERRSIRSFTDRKIAREDLEKIAKAAVYAPSGMNRQNCIFTVVQNTDIIEGLAECLRIKLNRDKDYNFYKPNALILCSAPRESMHAIEDCAVAMQNIMLAAHSLGVGSVWINQFKGVCDDPIVRTQLSKIGLPEDHLVWGTAALGYASEDAVRNFKKNEKAIKWVE